MDIIYKNTRHGYARIDKEGNLLITIPLFKKGTKFEEIMIEKGEKLLKNYNKRTHIDAIQQDHIVLFGEQVPLDDIKELYPKHFSNSKFQISNSKLLKSILEEYAKPILDECSKKIGKSYQKITIRKTTSKR